jgi:hypothetical protein
MNHEIDIQTDKLINCMEVDGKSWPNHNGTRATDIPVSGTHVIKIEFS